MPGFIYYFPQVREWGAVSEKMEDFGLLNSLGSTGAVNSAVVQSGPDKGSGLLCTIDHPSRLPLSVKEGITWVRCGDGEFYIGHNGLPEPKDLQKSQTIGDAHIELWGALWCIPAAPALPRTLGLNFTSKTWEYHIAPSYRHIADSGENAREKFLPLLTETYEEGEEVDILSDLLEICIDVLSENYYMGPVEWGMMGDIKMPDDIFSFLIEFLDLADGEDLELKKNSGPHGLKEEPQMDTGPQWEIE